MVLGSIRRGCDRGLVYASSDRGKIPEKPLVYLEFLIGQNLWPVKNIQVLIGSIKTPYKYTP